MKILKRVGLALAVVVLLLVVVIATRASTFHIERSMSMKATPAAVHAAVNDFHTWKGWSPWDKLDPAMKQTYSGAANGSGAEYHWIGNDEVGEGKMTITESTPQKITIRLEFIKPFAALNTTTFSFTAAGDQTQVVWAMDGTNDFMGKAFSLFMDMDKMIGADFDKGLASLKGIAEAAPPAAAAAPSAAPSAAPAAPSAAPDAPK